VREKEPELNDSHLPIRQRKREKKGEGERTESIKAGQVPDGFAFLSFFSSFPFGSFSLI